VSGKQGMLVMRVCRAEGPNCCSSFAGAMLRLPLAVAGWAVGPQGMDAASELQCALSKLGASSRFRLVKGWRLYELTLASSAMAWPSVTMGVGRPARSGMVTCS
jgi:hypothetical protein